MAGETVTIAIGETADVGGKRIKAIHGGAMNDGDAPPVCCVTIEVSDAPTPTPDKAPEPAVKPVAKKETPSLLERFLHS